MSPPFLTFIAPALFYVLAAVSAVALLLSMPGLVGAVRSPLPAFAFARAGAMGMAAIAAYLTAEGLRRKRGWATWAAAAEGALMLLVFPVGTVLGLLVIASVVASASRPPSVPFSLVLPLALLLTAGPVAVFVVSGRGTEMSPLLLYPFAFPWWLVLRSAGATGETMVLLSGCAINVVLLAVAGAFLDRRRSRAPSRS